MRFHGAWMAAPAGEGRDAMLGASQAVLDALGGPSRRRLRLAGDGPLGSSRRLADAPGIDFAAAPAIRAILGQ